MNTNPRKFIQFPENAHLLFEETSKRENSRVPAMDPFRHPFTNNNSSNNSRYVPPPRFPDADQNRYRLFHPPPQHHHHHRPPPPLHYYNSHNSNHDTLFIPSSPYPSAHPAYNPNILSPPPLIFHPSSPRVSDRDHHLPFPFRESDPNRSSPPSVWEEGSFARPSFAIDRDLDHRGIRLPPPEAAGRVLVRRKRFNSELERLEWQEFADDHIGDSWGRRDPQNHPRSHNQLRVVHRKTFPSGLFDDLDSMPVMVGPHGHSSGERGSRKRKPFDGITVHDRISRCGGAMEAVDEDGMWSREPSSSGFFSQSGKDNEEVVRGENGIRFGSGKHLTPAKTGKGKKTMALENKPQKKISALLRIQNGNNINRKRNDEQLHQSSHFGDSNAAATKGKSPSVFSDHRLEKVSSSVELDVSFKSNALVAKAIFPSGMGSNKKGLVKIKKKKKKVVNSVSHLPSSQGARTDNKDTMSIAHIPMEASEKLRVSEAGPVAVDAAAPASQFGENRSPIESIAVPAVHSVKENSKSTHVSFVEDVTDKLHSNVVDMAEISKDSATSDMKSPLSGVKGDMQDSNPAETATDCEEDSTEIGDKEGKLRRMEQAEVGDMEEHQMRYSEKCQDAAELHSEAREEMDTLPSEVQVLPTKTMEDNGCNEMVEGGLHPSDYTLMEAEAPLISTNNSIEEGTMHLLDRSSRIDSPESLYVVPEVGGLNEGHPFWPTPDENGSVDNNRQDEETVVRDDFSMIGNGPSVKSKVNGKSDERLLINNHMIIEKKLSLQSLTTKSTSTNVKSAPELLNCKTTAPKSSRISGSLLPRASFVSRPVKEMISATHTGRPRTWRRTDNSSACPSPVHESGLSSDPMERQSQKKVVKVQTPSYIRKGNSLVRKSTPVSSFSWASPGSGTLICRSNSKSEDTTKGCMVSKRNVDSTDSTSGGANPSFERPKTPPIPHTARSLTCMSKTSLDSFNSTSVDPLAQAGLEISACTTLDPIKSSSSKGFPGCTRTPENQAPDSVMSTLGTRSQLNDGKLKSPKAKRMIYVKRKSNQLVAAPRPEIRDSAIPNAEKTNSVYFKRRKNQLVRNNASLNVKVNQVIPIPDDGSNSEGQSAPEIISKCNRSLSKKILDRVLEKSCKPSKSSLVWTLSGSQSHNKDTNFLQREKVLPFLFPWKRTMYRRCSIRNIASASNMNPLSLIRKLKLSQQRDTVYTRSTNGFSLRKSRVLSIGGSNLKWSKSIERRSKKANEEATLAVAAAERKKREQKRAASTAKTKHGNPSTRKSAHGIELQAGERIFRVGSVRYKMDSSKRTLVRIPDEKSSPAVNLQSDEKTRISFVPRRLLIGNNEYIRIGNGNQLVRDPKKLSRILANEKIRWSLHTARLRLAKKQQYCQFFTRFGKCNKDGGKCPYIHDPAKVAVCTKFLKGRCPSSNCKLTHKVIPERMPDCSYFLQGLCTNESCPYRHVNVNPNASVCEGFLRGYCADGDECRRKHSYVCSVFEANGVCPQGSACKLHHPKTGNKSRKRKRSKDERNLRARYFRSLGLINAGVSKANASDDHSPEQRGDIFFCDGRYSDYISLDFVDEAAGDTNHKMATNAALSQGDPSDNLDVLIKPAHFINTSQHDEHAGIC